MKHKGFTLIELLIVFSITIILSTVGIAGYSSYSKGQKLTTSVNDVNTMLHKAKALTQAQTKPQSCVGFQGYQVQFCSISGSCISVTAPYELDVICNGTPQLVDEGILAEGVTFDTTLTQTPIIAFQAVDAGVTGYDRAVVMKLVGSTETKTITVSRLGVIQIN